MFCCSQLSTMLNNIVTPDSGSTILLTSVNNVGSKTLFNPVKQQAHKFMRVNDNGHLLNTILDVTSFQTP
jgi:hypothetical protein